MVRFSVIEPSASKSRSACGERLQYFVVNAITDSIRQRDLLVALCSAKGFETGKAVISLSTLVGVDFAELVAALGAHYDPQPSELYSR